MPGQELGRLSRITTKRRQYVGLEAVDGRLTFKSKPPPRGGGFRFSVDPNRFPNPEDRRDTVFTISPLGAP